jgi:hypothetical protein
MCVTSLLIQQIQTTAFISAASRDLNAFQAGLQIHSLQIPVHHSSHINHGT